LPAVLVIAPTVAGWLALSVATKPVVSYSQLL
jgi:hypothetical protein